MKSFQCLPECTLLAKYVAKQVLAFKKIKVSQRDRAGHRMPAKRVAVGEGGVSLSKRFEMASEMVAAPSGE
jgi:hypothetical protein